MKVSVINTPDAFAITKPNSALVWKSGSTQTVTWNVNKTNLNPIKCTQVRILLSVDGGLTYTVLVETTPNDGNQLVVLPSGTTTTRARIKVEAIGNIFFDVSNVDFKIIS